jgi:cytochrome c oxidase cbb3-type subunit 1
VKSTFPFYAIRLAGGALYLSGMLLMAYNVFKTVIGEKAVNPEIPADSAAVRPTVATAPASA